jgi:hypothetical protein
MIPIGDPSGEIDTQKLTKAQALMELRGGRYDDAIIERRYLEALNIPNIDELIPEKPPESPPEPKVMVDLQKLELERDKHELKLFMTQFEIAKIQADVILKLADAESKEMGPQLEQYKAQMDSLTKQSIAMMQKKEQANAASKQSSGGAN